MPDARFISFFLFLLITRQLAAQETPGKDDYEIVRQDEKITMYERWTPYPGSTTNSRQVKCVFQVNTELKNLFSYLYEKERIKTWQENLLEYTVTPKSDSTWVAYSYYRIPWPLSNQDYLLRYTILEKNEKRMVITFEHLVDEKLGAIRPSVDRRPTIGKWELEKLNDQIKVTYTITSLPLSTPRFITDRIVHNNLMSTINKLILVAEK